MQETAKNYGRYTSFRDLPVIENILCWEALSQKISKVQTEFEPKFNPKLKVSIIKKPVLKLQREYWKCKIEAQQIFSNSYFSYFIHRTERMCRFSCQRGFERDRAGD